MRTQASAADPAELLSLARVFLSRPDAKTAGVWPRASALLARQALEAALDGYWAARGIAFETRSSRAKLICLAQYLDDRELAGRVHHAWGALSDACHHHAYELAPTVAELTAMLDVVEAFVVRPSAA